MLPSNTSVPVYIEVTPSDLLRGVFGIEGALRFEDETITFEYQTRDKRSRLSSVTAFQIPLAEVREVDLKKGVANAKIILRPRQLTTLDEVSWASCEEIVFHLMRRHHKEAASLVAQLQDAIEALSTSEMSSIPFKLPATNLGFTEISGLLYIDSEFLVFEVATSLSGGSKSKKQTIMIEPEALAEVRLDRGLMRDRLIVRPKKIDLLVAMPGSYEEALTLTIKKQYREEAEYLVHEIRRRSRQKNTA